MSFPYCPLLFNFHRDSIKNGASFPTAKNKCFLSEVFYKKSLNFTLTLNFLCVLDQINASGRQRLMIGDNLIPVFLTPDRRDEAQRTRDTYCIICLSLSVRTNYVSKFSQLVVFTQIIRGICQDLNFCRYSNYDVTEMKISSLRSMKISTCISILL